MSWPLLFFARPPLAVSRRFAGGCGGCGMVCGGGRAGCLRAFSSPVSLSRCRSFTCCYMLPCRRFALFYPGRCVAIYGLFLPLSCRRWRILIYAIKWHPVASHGHFRRCCPMPFLGSPRRLVLAPLPCCLSLLGCGVMAFVRACFCGELVKTARVRSFVSGAVSPLLVSCGWCGIGVIVCHAGRGWRRRVAVLAFIGSLIPCPLGRGTI